MTWPTEMWALRANLADAVLSTLYGPLTVVSWVFFLMAVLFTLTALATHRGGPVIHPLGAIFRRAYGLCILTYLACDLGYTWISRGLPYAAREFVEGWPQIGLGLLMAALLWKVRIPWKAEPRATNS